MKNADVLNISNLNGNQRAKLLEFCFNANLDVSIGLSLSEATQVYNQLEQEQWESSWESSDPDCI